MHIFTNQVAICPAYKLFFTNGEVVIMDEKKETDIVTIKMADKGEGVFGLHKTFKVFKNSR